LVSYFLEKLRKGFVISTSPGPGKTLANGTKVNIVVSSGPPKKKKKKKKKAPARGPPRAPPRRPMMTLLE
jgi:beta-lactam-binding protein with PASTA domain